MATFIEGKSLENNNVRVTKSSLRFGPLTIERVPATPTDSEGRIGDIVIVDDSMGSSPTLPIDRIPTNIGLFQKNTTGVWQNIGFVADDFVNTTGDTMTGDLIMNGANIGINTTPGYSLDIDATDAIRLPVGTAAQRPVNVPGLLRFNSDADRFEGFDGTDWEEVSITQDFKRDNVIIVSTDGSNPATQFTSIKAAIDSITDASDTKRYSILVDPGVYVEDTIQMKPFVSVIAQGVNQDSAIEPSDPNNDIILGADFSLLQGFQLRGATGPGAAAIRVTNTPLNRFEVTNGGVTNCSIHHAVNSSAARANLRLHKSTETLTDAAERGLEIISGAGGTANITITTSSFRVSGDANLTEGMLVSGPDATLLLAGPFLLLGRSPANGGPTPVPGLVIEDGAELTIFTGIIDNFDINLQSKNVGAGPIITSLTSRFVDSITRDISIEHPGTTGSIFTTAQRSKVFVDPAANISIVYADPIDTGFVSAGPLFLGDTHDALTDSLDLILLGGMSGRIDGGELSNGAGAFDVDVAEGFGYLLLSGGNLQRTKWVDTTLTLPSDSISWIFVNSAGNVTFAASRPNEFLNIILGRIISNSADLLTLEQLPANANQSGNRFNTTLREALGPVYVSGSLVAESGTVARELVVGSGAYFVSQSKFTPSGGSPITFTEFFHSSGSFTTNSGQTVVNNTQWDNGTDLVALSAGFFAKHSLYVSGDGINESYFFVFAQEEHADLIAAEAGDIPLPPVSFTGGNIALIATIIVQEGAANIDIIQDARPILGFKPLGVSATTEHGNLFGLLADDHPQYFLVDGTRIMGGNINMGNNDITDVNLVDGVDVSDHQARHLPNGADPITTAGPTDPLTATTTNSVGIQNSLSRSDHGHAITTGASTLTLGPDSVNSVGSAASLARSDHGHAFAIGTPVTLDPTSVNTEGVANLFARSDHIHAISTGTPSTTLAPDDINATGSASTLARSDHLHQFALGTAITLTPSTTNTEGTANSFARSDHTHAITGFQETISFEDEGISVGGPFTIVNFVGDGVSATDAGGGQIDVSITNSVIFTFTLQAEQFDNPNNADWVVNALAPAVADTLNQALVVRRFDDTVEEGVGFLLPIPTIATSITLRYVSRAQTSPGSPETVQPVLYRRTIPNNAAVTAWSAGLLLDTIAIPTNTNFQYDNQTITLVTLGLTAGTTVQFELTRQGTAGGDTLTGDWNLLQLEVEFN